MLEAYSSFANLGGYNRNGLHDVSALVIVGGGGGAGVMVTKMVKGGY